MEEEEKEKEKEKESPSGEKGEADECGAISPSDRVLRLIDQLPRYRAFDSWFITTTATTTTTTDPSSSSSSTPSGRSSLDAVVTASSPLETWAKKCESAVSLVKIKCYRKILPESPEVWTVYFQPFPTLDLFLCSKDLSSQHVEDLNELVKSDSFRLCSKLSGGNEVEYHGFCEDEYVTDSYLKRGLLSSLFLKYLRDSGKMRDADPETIRRCEERLLKEKNRFSPEG